MVLPSQYLSGAALEGFGAERAAAAVEAAMDTLRRTGRFEQIRGELRTISEASADMPDPADAAIPDERLRLIFTCCHPAFAAEVQVALTLRTVCGLPVAKDGSDGAWMEWMEGASG